MVPNRNSVTGTEAKKRKESQTSEKMMPTVVRTATAEQANRTMLIQLSTRLRARRSGRMRTKTKTPPRMAAIRAATPPPQLRADEMRWARRPSAGSSSA
ncbi:hypothetical protein D3C86_1606840 [compost metagenome]